jgi:hypothetical protein
MGLTLHGPFVEKTELAKQALADDLATKKDVGGDRQIGRNAGVLVERFDSGLQGILG